MLVLARKPNESIQIGEEVRVVVVQIRPGRVRLGIEAPANVRIRRSEVAPLDGAETVEFEFAVPMEAG